jgi:hypothetical protein
MAHIPLECCDETNRNPQIFAVELATDPDLIAIKAFSKIWKIFNCLALIVRDKLG